MNGDQHALGVVVSLARIAELRATIASAELSNAAHRVGRVGLLADAYAVDFNGVILVAVYDRRGRSIATFLPPAAPEIIHADVDARGPGGAESVVEASSGPALAR